MIYEQMPQLHALTPEEKTALAAELLHEASKPGLGEPDPGIVDLLRQRQREYEANPSATLTWEQVKARVLGENG
jgi:hypothetical protein